MKQIPGSLLTLVIGVVVTLISLWVGQHHGLLPEQASEQAPLVDQLFDTMFTIGTALFLVVEGAILFFVFRFRQVKGDDSDGSPIEGNVPLEIFWTLIPAIIVVGIGVYSVNVFQDMGGFAPAGHHSMGRINFTVASHLHPDREFEPVMAAMSGLSDPHLEWAAEVEDVETDAPSDFNDPAEVRRYGIGASPYEEDNPPDLVVDVTGLQYAWLFDYPASEVMAGELHVPINADVQLNISAADVIHSFWVPQFRLKQDAIPGQPTQLRFKATRLGEYPVVCAELCGAYHGGMRTTVMVEEMDAFEAWLAENSFAQADPDRQVAMQPTSVTGSDFGDIHLHHLGLPAEGLDQHL